MLIRAAIVCLVLGIAWLMAGRRLILLLDRCITIRTVSLPVSPAKYDGGGFRFGELVMTFGGTNNLRSDIGVTSSPANRVTLVAGNAAFPLGLRAAIEHPRGYPDIDIESESGDA